MKNIVDTAVAAGNFKTLVKAVTEAGLANTLSGEGPFTVFAPNDKAFDILPKGALEALLNDKEKLKSVLLYHVVSGKVLSSEVSGMDSAETMQGDDVDIDVENGTVKINDSKVINADIECSNGVIHVIDRVLMPE